MRDVRGVGVNEIVKDSPAEKAGIQRGDVIIGFGIARLVYKRMKSDPATLPSNGTEASPVLR